MCHYEVDPKPRGPWFIDQHDMMRVRDNPQATVNRVYRYWPVLMPEGGVVMCSTDADADRVARELNALQAKIDALMLEYCPDDMTDEQRANWARHQRPVEPERRSFLDTLRKLRP